MKKKKKKGFELQCSPVLFLFLPKGEQNHDSSRGPQRPEVNHPRMGHEVMPGVFSSVPRGRASLFQKKA